MRWKVDDEGSYHRVVIRESEPRPDCNLCRLVCTVHSPALAFHEPTDKDREEMLATARGIVERHDCVTVAEEQFAVIAKRAESYKAALGMVAQIIHGSTRVTHMIAQAALDGADFTDDETAIKVAEGKWRKP